MLNNTNERKMKKTILKSLLTLSICLVPNLSTMIRPHSEPLREIRYGTPPPLPGQVIEDYTEDWEMPDPCESCRGKDRHIKLLQGQIDSLLKMLRDKKTQ